MGPKMHRLRRLIYLALALALAPGAARAALPDQCGRARDRAFAADTAKDIASGTVLFVCYGHYVSGMKVLLTPKDGGDFALTVAVDGHVYSALILGKEVERLRAQSGNYVLNSDKSCFIRSKLTKPAILYFGGGKDVPGDLSYFAARDSLDYIDCDAPK
jgi:hypothetical protein